MSKTTIPIAKPDDVSGGKALIERLKNASFPDQNGCRLFTADLTQEAAEALTAASERIRVLQEALEFYADPYGKCDQVPDFYTAEETTNATIFSEIAVELDRKIEAVLTDRGSVPAERLKQFLWDNKVGLLRAAEVAALQRPTQSTQEHGEAPGAEAVAEALFDAELHRHPNGNVPFRDIQPPEIKQSFLDKAVRFQIALQRQNRQPVPVPAPGVTVTDEMVDVAFKAFYDRQIKMSRGDMGYMTIPLHAALSAALRPKE